jgi:HD-GYP domain-containing protein (c-di-GMP phosphodiesterase class II)
MKKHPLFAKRLLESIDYLKPALEIPLYHHEQWDGSGYPYGLEGEEIPLAARIFAVVDVWDALLSDRPYREAWSEEKVLNHIREQAGSHFDPQVVEQFLAFVMGDNELSSGKQGRVQT